MTIREKILVIEDEKSISHFISTVLNNNGYEAMQAQTGEEALSMISSHCPDLVILDLGLPDMDGLDILRSLRSWSSLPVVVVSARSHERDKVTALDLGADDYLTKPFGTDELLARVRTAIRHTRTHLPNGDIAFTLSGGILPGMLELRPDGLPVRWSAEKGWIMDIAYDDGNPPLPYKFKLTHPDGYSAILLVKNRQTPDAAFRDDQLALELPAGTIIEPIKRGDN